MRLGANEQLLAVNPIILGELAYGILLLPGGHGERDWSVEFAEGVAKFHVLDIDADSARAWAGLLADLKRQGHACP